MLFRSPHIVELRGTTSLILQCARHFLMVDTLNGLQVINYDGRVVSQPKFQAMRPDALSTLNVGYSPDLLAVISHADAKTCILLDPLTGKQLGTVAHTIEIEQVALSQRGDLSRRRLVIVDKNRDLYLTPVQGAQELYKLHIMVDTVAWNVESDALSAVADGHLLVWFYPEVVYMDRELLASTVSRQAADWGKTCEIVEFRERACRCAAPTARPSARGSRHTRPSLKSFAATPSGSPRFASAATSNRMSCGRAWRRWP